MSSTSNSFDLPASDVGSDSKRAREFKVIALIAIAHFVSHVHIMLLPPLFGEVREAFGVSYVEIGFANERPAESFALRNVHAMYWCARTGHIARQKTIYDQPAGM